MDVLAAVVPTDGVQHIGDEERTPHDQEQKEHNPQDFGGSLFIFQSAIHALSAFERQAFDHWKRRDFGGGLAVQETCVTSFDGRMHGGALAVMGEGLAVFLEMMESEVIADHHDDQRNEEGHD